MTVAATAVRRNDYRSRDGRMHWWQWTARSLHRGLAFTVWSISAPSRLDHCMEPVERILHIRVRMGCARSRCDHSRQTERSARGLHCGLQRAVRRYGRDPGRGWTGVGARFRMTTGWSVAGTSWSSAQNATESVFHHLSVAPRSRSRHMGTRRSPGRVSDRRRRGTVTLVQTLC